MDEEIVDRVLTEDGETMTKSTHDEPAEVAICATLLIGVLAFVATEWSPNTSAILESIVILVGCFALGMVVSVIWSRVRSRI